MPERDDSPDTISQRTKAGAGEAPLHVDRGFRLLKERNYTEAAGSFERAIALDPGHARGYYGRGLSRHELGDLERALSDYDRSIELDPRVARAFLNRGRLRLQRGDIEKAFLDYDEAVRLDPGDAAPRLARGLAHKELGNRDEALKDLDEAVRLDPESATAHRVRCLLFQELGKTREALEDIERAMELETAASATAMKNMSTKKSSLIFSLIQEHFDPEPIGNITITERQFPFRVRADLQRAMDRLFTEATKVVHFCGVKEHFSHEGLEFSGLIAPNPHQPALSVPPEYEEIDIGEEQAVRCLKNGLWLLEEGSHRFMVLLAPAGRHFQVTGLKFQIATVNGREGTRITQEFFKHLEDSVLRSESYRGKVLSLEVKDGYSGRSTGLMVHRLRSVSRDDVILPRKTLDLLDRNAIDFTRHRVKLARYGLSTKKGLLFYGPPGTGKTHTIHYLARALEGHTTFLISAEQVGLLGEYMTLARLLQPSIVVIEDVDLIARDRNTMESVCEEILLNKLLNEMDGLRPDADVLFILTTNRPESLEKALASRPGRVDQAIEFPLPDEEGRTKLIRLYSHGLSVPEDLVRETVKKTENVSASFIKELMRRAAQFQIERGAEEAELTQADIDNALDELLFAGGSLNRKLLGADQEDI